MTSARAADRRDSPARPDPDGTGPTTAGRDGTDSTTAGPERYRLRSGVRLVGRVLLSRRPLLAVRLNDAGAAVVDALSSESYRSADAVARAVDHDSAFAEGFLASLTDAGFLDWAPGRNPGHRPPVSVVVTVRDQADHLARCLDALDALSYPTYEVVVVDDGSTDGSASVARSHSLAARGRVRVVAVGSPDAPLGIGASRDAGAAAASHDVVAFTDADCRPRPSWLAALVPSLAYHDVVGGRIRPLGRGSVARYEGAHSSLDMGPRPARVDRSSSTPYLPTANLVCRRSVVTDVGFPDRNVAEDVGFCWDACDRGYDVVYAATGTVDHDYEADARRLAERRVSYGGSEALLAASYGHPGSVTLPLLSGSGVALAAALAAVGAPRSWLFVAVGLVVVLSLVSVGASVWNHARSVGTLVRPADSLASAGRGFVSAWYAVAREVGRYYTLPLGGIALLLWGVGLGRAGVVLAAVTTAAALGPLVIDYAVRRPALGPHRYLALALLDALAYQIGVYRGAVSHGTVAHLVPWVRFQVRDARS